MWAMMQKLRIASGGVADGVCAVLAIGDTRGYLGLFVPDSSYRAHGQDIEQDHGRPFRPRRTDGPSMRRIVPCSAASLAPATILRPA